MLSTKKQEHALYKALFENAYSVMLILDPDTGNILDANKAAVSFYQYPKNELLAMNISQINMLSKKEIQKEMENATLQKRNYFNFKHQLKNGEIKEVETYTGPIEYKNKTMLCSIIHDITHRKLAEDTLKKSENMIRTMINATDSMVYLFDLKGKILDMNQEGARLFKKNSEEMIGKNFKPFFSESDFSRLTWLVKKVKDTKESLSYQRTRDDRYFEVSLYPVFNKKEEVTRICVFAKDITDLKQTEKVLAAIETAGGICHEMNQPLQVILGNLELLKMNVKGNDPNLKFINALMAQTDRLGKITQKLTHITRYETKKYIKGTIFDIDRSTIID
ncbi:MAG: PAS domain S-box protein [Pseudomonadota bacterium]